MERKMIKSEHHRGEEMPLWVVLSDLAAQENCDGSPYDEMQIASDYIKALEEELEPYREMEKRLYEKIRKLDERDREITNPKIEERGMYRDFDIQEVGKDSHMNQPPMDHSHYQGCCIICGGSSTYPDHATMADQCSYCGQKYRRY